MRRAMGVVFALALAAPAWADDVVLKNGNVLSGRILVETDDAVVLEVSGGRITISRAQIERVERSDTPLHEWDRRYAAACEAGTLDAFVDAARWAETNRLPARAADAWHQVLAKDSGHEEARRALGFVRYQEEWLTREEFNRAIGLVRFRGRWVTTAERDLTLAEEAERGRGRDEARAEREREYEEAVRAQREWEEGQRRRAEEAMWRPTGPVVWPSGATVVVISTCAMGHAPGACTCATVTPCHTTVLNTSVRHVRSVVYDSPWGGSFYGPWWP